MYSSKINKFKGKQSTLKKKLWKVFSEFIRLRDKYVCISCGKQLTKQNSDAGHYKPKTCGLSIYFDEKNVNCQCTYCNRWMHGNLSSYAVALRAKYGKTILEELEYKSQRTLKITELEYQFLIDFYKKKLKELKEDYARRGITF